MPCLCSALMLLQAHPQEAHRCVMAMLQQRFLGSIEQLGIRPVVHIVQASSRAGVCVVPGGCCDAVSQCSRLLCAMGGRLSAYGLQCCYKQPHGYLCSWLRHLLRYHQPGCLMLLIMLPPAAAPAGVSGPEDCRQNHLCQGRGPCLPARVCRSSPAAAALEAGTHAVRPLCAGICAAALQGAAHHCGPGR